MKKIFKSIMVLPAVVCGMMLTGCEKDIDSNPVLAIDESLVDNPNAVAFTLNTPANAANNVYDLIVPDATLNLTCSQPSFGGMPLVVDYFVQVSLDNNFTDEGRYIELATSYNTASMMVNARQINDAMIELYKNANGDVEYPEGARALYVRLRATLNRQDMGNLYSNVIELPNVLATYKAPELSYSTSLYVVGSSIQNAWNSWKPLAPVYGMDGEFYTLVYFPDGGAFKWGESEGDWRGYDRLAAINDNANAGLEADGDGNIKVNNGGWYLLYFTSKIGASEIAYTLNVEAAHAYIIGAVAGGSWTDKDAAWEMTPSADNTGEWVSPTMTAGGELRAYISVPGIDWWRTEFTLFNGDLFWRTMDIPDNWAANVGAEYSVSCNVGQKLYVNFDTNKGEVR